MSARSQQDRRATWAPPPRPEWLRRLNEEGSYMNLTEVVPLDEESLINAAKRDTGLEDFGDESWHEPFTVLIKALEEEARLHLMGRLMTRSDLVMFLKARLQIEETYKRHPEIDDERIEKPLVIVGQGRTGTSFLQNTLATDPGNGTPRYWEAMFPCPPPEKATYATSPQVAAGDKLITQWSRAAPEIESMHEFAGHLPTENIHLHCLSFRSPAWFMMLGQVPSYAGYMMNQDPALTYRHERRVLKLLQWRNPRKHWILKSPYALNEMPAILAEYPDAGFIWTHRDPVKALASAVDLIGTLYWMRTDEPFRGDGLAQFTSAELSAAMMSRPIDWLESGQLPRDRLVNVQYLDFVADPMGTIERIYQALGVEMIPEGHACMERYIKDNARSNRPAHTYEFGSDEVVSRERAAFTRYQEYFGVPDEI
ncbi:MAG TPA: sulfotransferase [Trebonia sp.]|jgi:hypothetical protein